MGNVTATHFRDLGRQQVRVLLSNTEFALLTQGKKKAQFLAFAYDYSPYVCFRQ